MEKIQTSSLNTSPLWKNQIIIARGIFNQVKAFNMQKEVDKMTNDLLIKNSQMLKETNLISMPEETIAIQKKAEMSARPRNRNLPSSNRN